ncbi:hypothetical protein [Lacisediminimonas sp.]|uniref:hypothetical protein n=1 Tax=Lacisediminimonas sp. TaxID=3060582 RepID=UPI00271FF15B|nr:hypothetical protein [Lacisediminimonas sp.]MDO8301118.1 hypothetical protein [Lacisediminimonas sp.]
MGQQLEKTEPASGASASERPSIGSLQAKGSCWYCDQAVDNVRRFCSPACRNDYLEEEAGYADVVSSLSTLPPPVAKSANPFEPSQGAFRSTVRDPEIS